MRANGNAYFRGLIRGLKELMHLKDFGTGCPAHNMFFINHSCKDFFFLLRSWRDQKEEGDSAKETEKWHQQDQGGGNQERGVSWKRRGENARKEGDLT